MCGLKVITRRNGSDCSKPYSNSLCLPADMAIPVENELTSDSDNYADNYACFLSRAKEAGNEAANAIQRAKDDLDNQDAATLRVENQRQDALDRIEQICGVGQTSCSTPRVDRKLRELQLLPVDTGSGGDCDTAPMIGALMPAQMSAKFIDQVGGIDVRGLPAIFEQAALAGELTNLSFYEFGGEYKTALLDLSSSLVDLRFAVASTNTVLKALPSLVEAEKCNILAMQIETAALILDTLSKALKPGIAGSGVFASIASGFRALANIVKTMAQTHEFMIVIQDQVSKIEQNMLSVEKAVLAMKAAIERLNGLELEQQQVRDRAERLAQADLAQYVGDNTTNKLKAFRQLTLVSQLTGSPAN